MDSGTNWRAAGREGLKMGSAGCVALRLEVSSDLERRRALRGNLVTSMAVHGRELLAADGPTDCTVAVREVERSSDASPKSY